MISKNKLWKKYLNSSLNAFLSALTPTKLKFTYNISQIAGFTNDGDWIKS